MGCHWIIGGDCWTDPRGLELGALGKNKAQSYTWKVRHKTCRNLRNMLLIYKEVINTKEIFETKQNLNNQLRSGHQDLF